MKIINPLIAKLASDYALDHMLERINHAYSAEDLMAVIVNDPECETAQIFNKLLIAGYKEIEKTIQEKNQAN